MEHWAAGYTQSELDAAQERYSLCFPPDLVSLYLERTPVQGYDWRREDPRIREMVEWPVRSLLWDVEQNLWWPAWGSRPSNPEERAEIVLNKAPRLIPICGHRFLPETPCETGNPVFSMYGFDTIYYGANLAEYFDNEFNSERRIGHIRHVPFWSDITERYDLVEKY